MSHTTSPTILVIGSTGKTGSRIVKRLEAQGRSVRHGSRSATPPFDWEDRSTWAPALAGVDAAYIAYYPDLLAPQAKEDLTALTEAAKSAGVRHLVLLSGRGEAQAAECEQIVRDSGLSFTSVRASWYFENFTEGMLAPAVAHGVIAMPAGQVREPFIAADDIADVAVAALTDPSHAGKTYELTGPRLMTFTDVAQEISDASGRHVEYVPVSFDEFHAGLTAEVGTDTADLMTELCKQVLDGRNENLTADVETVLGRPGRDFAEFVAASAEEGSWT